MKKLIFTTLVSIASAAGAALAVRAVDAAWRKTQHRRPPPTSKWVEMLLGFALSRPIARKLGAKTA